MLIFERFKSKINEKSTFSDLNQVMEHLTPKSEQLHCEFMKITSRLNAGEQILRGESEYIDRIGKKLDLIRDKNGSLATDLKYYSGQVSDMENLMTMLEDKVDQLSQPDLAMYSNTQRQNL